jgi:hypothetical protein
VNGSAELPPDRAVLLFSLAHSEVVPETTLKYRGTSKGVPPPVGYLGQKSGLNRTKHDSLRRAQINLPDSGPPWTELGLFSWLKAGKTVPCDYESKPKMRAAAVVIGQEGTRFRVVE